ncbi:hypothetical protein [uncultured Nocardioides sp.]|jgi:hypothetical protein|uniref:hypothetical protein n=1 Tax=uncultured Nocardioides sp. TaxID=198441 RepID=UPI002631926E|nr:hypothetical protein [uncultured Nocardioides sp.]HRD59386.1 hypothetical protein [Nocardioides sp.]
MSNRIRSTVALVAVLGAMGIAPAAHADQQGPPCPPEGCVTSPPPITPGTGGVCTLADLDYVSDLLYEARRELTIEQRAHKQQHRRANRLEREVRVQAGIIKRLRAQLEGKRVGTQHSPR